MNFLKKNWIEKVLLLIVVILVAISAIVGSLFTTDFYGDTEKSEYIVMKEYEVEAINDAATPQKIRNRLKFTLQMTDTTFNYLIFHTSHQEVEIHFEDKLIYSCLASDSNFFGKTTGDVWNMIQINAENVGKEITVDFIPIYSDSTSRLPIIYYGDRYNIMLDYVFASFPILFLSVALIVVGGVYVMFAFYTNKKDSGSRTVMLGLFAVATGLWKLFDAEIISMFIHNGIAVSLTSIFSMMLMCIPYCLYVRQRYQPKDHWIWRVPIIASIATVFVSVVLQLTNIADFKQTLFLTYITVVITVVVHFIMMVKHTRVAGLNPHLKVRIFAAFTFIIGMIIDTIVYMTIGYKYLLVFSLVGITFYVIMLVLESIREMRALINIGQETRKLEDLAYHDKLTGLYNRTAYAEDTQPENVRPEHMIVVICDLNNLKFCNDNFGHEQGDLYITTCAKLIKEAFSDIGKCYRIGGDEFCVIVVGQSMATCKIRLHNLNESLSEMNAKKTIDMKMQIAYGCVSYDKDIDFDIQDTIRRADRLMYEDKFNKKQWL